MDEINEIKILIENVIDSIDKLQNAVYYKADLEYMSDSKMSLQIAKSILEKIKTK